MQIHLLSDALVVVASLDLKVPIREPKQRTLLEVTDVRKVVPGLVIDRVRR